MVGLIPSKGRHYDCITCCWKSSGVAYTYMCVCVWELRHYAGNYSARRVCRALRESERMREREQVILCRSAYVIIPVMLFVVQVVTM